MVAISQKRIAKLASVAQADVSRILNNRPNRVHMDKQKEVLRIAREYKYCPNSTAKSLKSGRTNTIGIASGIDVIRGDGIDPYLNRLLVGIGTGFKDTDYRLLNHRYHRDKDRNQSLELIRSHAVDGLIFIIYSQWVGNFNRVYIPLLKEAGVPFVVIHSLKDQMDAFNVGLDCEKAGYLACEHLIEHGYPTIGMVRRSGIPHIDGMYAGYRKALEKYNTVFNEDHVYEVALPKSRGGYELAQKLVNSSQDLPRALYVYDDPIAYGLMDGLTRAGVKVPEDIAIIGFDDNHDQGLIPTRLTSVLQPGREKGQLAARMLIRQINEQDANPETVIMEPTLTIRESCGCKQPVGSWQK